MICTGVCALFMRFITPMRPADLSDEDIKKELEAEKKTAVTEQDLRDVKYDPKVDAGKPPDAPAKPTQPTPAVATPAAQKTTAAQAPPATSVTTVPTTAQVAPATPTIKKGDQPATPVAKKVDEKK